MKTCHDQNPLSARQTDFIAVIEDGDTITPNEIISRNALAFSGPVVCLVTGSCGLDGYWQRNDWDYPVPVGSSVRFVETPQGKIGAILGAVLTIVASVYTGGLFAGTMASSLAGAAVSVAGSLLMGMLFSPSSASADNSKSKTAYSLTNNNRMRPGEPFAERFGRRRFYPDVAMSYTRFEHNIQYLYLILIVGVGEYGDITPTIGKTPLSDYSGATYAKIEPGALPTLCTDVVWTSTEANGQELTTSFIDVVATPRGHVASTIEVDFTFGALIRYAMSGDDAGQSQTHSVPLEVRARTIDDYGVATSEWFVTRVTYSGKTKNPLRRTFLMHGPFGPGRYEVGSRRVKSASGAGSITDNCTLSGVKTIGGKHPAVAGVTMWEARIKASNQLSGDAAAKIELEATRKLHPVMSGGFGIDKEESRSIIDACAYMVLADNGGRFSSSIMAWGVLAELRAEFAAAGYLFDGGFTSRGSVMDACTTAAACGLAVPYTPGGLFCIAANTEQTAYGTPFTDDDFDPGSFKITTNFKTAASNTCIRVKYYDRDTGQDETVDCYETGGGTSHPKDVTLDGCTVRQQAYAVGMILYRDMVKSTIDVEFTTGLKGNLPSMFSWLPVASASANYNQTGVIAAVETGGIVWTSEPLDFGGESSGWLLISLPDGSTSGPHTITPTEYAHKHLCALPTLPTIEADGYGAKYIFGPQSVAVRVVRVMSISPEGRDKVTIFGQVVDESIYDYIGTAPTFSEEEILSVDPLRAVAVAVDDYDTTTGTISIHATWSGSAAAFRVEVDYGSGYSILHDDYSLFSAAASHLGTSGTVRVTPYVDDALVPDEALTSAFSIMPPPATITIAVTADDTISVIYSEVPGVTGYSVIIEVGGVETLIAEKTITTSTTIVGAMVRLSGGPWSEFTVKVAGVVGGVVGAYGMATYTATVTPSTDLMWSANDSTLMWSTDPTQKMWS
jgi:hypothetical protein